MVTGTVRAMVMGSVMHETILPLVRPRRVIHFRYVSSFCSTINRAVARMQLMCPMIRNKNVLVKKCRRDSELNN